MRLYLPLLTRHRSPGTPLFRLELSPGNLDVCPFHYPEPESP